MRGKKSAKVSEGKVKHLISGKIADYIHNTVRANGFKWRPYIFRSYFDTALMLAESKGKISHAYQQFFMGHKRRHRVDLYDKEGQAVRGCAPGYARGLPEMPAVHVD